MAMTDERRAAARNKLHSRPNGTVVAKVSLTLAQKPDAAVIRALETAPSMGRLAADALRAYVERFRGLPPEARFRPRKDGRLVLSVDLEFWPGRDAALIEALQAADDKAVPTLVVSMMRDGGLARRSEQAADDEMSIAGLALDL